MSLGFIWYASVCAVQFFEWERKRSLAKCESWEAPRFAKVCAFIYTIGLTVSGLGLVVFGFGSVIVRIIGIPVLVVGALLLYDTLKGGWPGNLA